MSGERLENLRPSWIAFGWFIAAAFSSLLVLGFAALGLLHPDTTRPNGVWISLALVLGFLAGGFFTGFRAISAPILHGLGIGLFTLVVWLVVNLFPGEVIGWTAWRELPTSQAVALLFLITVAAVIGARIGARWAR